MPYLVAAVVVVAAVTLLNLALVLAIVRRLREHTELISRAGSGSAAGEGLLAVGDRIGEFEATTVDGVGLDRGDLGPGTAVAFFSPHCQPCHERLPEFVEHAAGLPDRRLAVAVVVGDGDDAEAGRMVAELRASALVLSGPAAEPLVAAFGTESYPAIYRMGPDGTVAAASHGTAVLRTPVAAR